MAEVHEVCDSDSDLEASVPVKPQPKRRRIIHPSSIAAVSIYSNKVNSSSGLQLKPTSFTQNDAVGDNAEVNVWVESTPAEKKRPRAIVLTDSEEESEEEPEMGRPRVEIRSPSPSPPPGTPTMNMSKRQIRAMEKRNFGSRSPSLASEGAVAPPECPAPLDPYDDDDIIIMSPSNTRPRSRPAASEGSPQTPREFPLKFRCRTDLYKIPVLSTAPLVKAVEKLSVKLKVPPSRVLLLRRDMELPVHSTANELGLGIADIIDCIIRTTDDQLNPESLHNSDIITLRLQGKSGSGQEYSLHKDAPFSTILSQYLSSFAADARRKVRFRFDGSEIQKNQTPSQMDLEDGDVIEVWS